VLADNDIRLIAILFGADVFVDLCLSDYEGQAARLQ
jgi:hypothetical protein